MLYPIKSATRTLECLDGIWETVIDGVSRYMAVPGSWNEQYSELFNYFGKCKYIKDVYVSAPTAGREYRIRFGAATTNAELYVNGVRIGEHRGTALPFEFNISNALHYDEINRIELTVDNTLDPWGLPPAAEGVNEARVGFFNSYPAVTYDFFPYGGIHRSVWLYEAPATRIEDIKIDAALSGKVDFRLRFTRAIDATVKASVDGVTYEYSVTGDCLSDSFTLTEPRIWDIGRPELYEVRFDVFVGDKLLDSYTQSFGVREISVSGYEIYLNGRKIFLKGFGKHEDFAIIGKGYNNAVTVKDFALLKWIGANSFRTSHYPYDERMLEYADKSGILVIDETPFVGLNDRMYRDDILNRAKDVIGELITRDYNHPSVIMWSLANEPTVRSDAGERFFKEMYDTARSLDKRRPITYASHLEPEDNRGQKYYDVICINKYYGWYVAPGQLDATLPEFSACMDRFFKAYGKPVIVTEFGADAVAGEHSEPAQMFSEEYQCEMIEKQYKLMRTKPYIAGAHVWAFADFKTAQSISRIILNRKGVFTRDRRPKMSASLLRKLWHDE